MHPPSQSTRRWSRDQRRRIGAREETSFHYSVGVSSVRFSSGPAAALRVYFTVQSLPCFCWPKWSCVICNQKGSNKCTDERREKASICINDLHEKKEALLQWKRETRLGRSSTQPEDLHLSSVTRAAADRTPPPSPVRDVSPASSHFRLIEFSGQCSGLSPGARAAWAVEMSILQWLVGQRAQYIGRNHIL